MDTAESGLCGGGDGSPVGQPLDAHSPPPSNEPPGSQSPDILWPTFKSSGFFSPNPTRLTPDIKALPSFAAASRDAAAQPARRLFNSAAPPLPRGYQMELIYSPVQPSVAAAVNAFVRHRGELWLKDMAHRFHMPGGAMWVLCYSPGGRVAAHCCVTWDPGLRPVADGKPGAGRGMVGILNHVFVVKQQRRQGIASAVVTAAVRRFDAIGGAAVLLTADGPACAALGDSLGWQTIAEEVGGKAGAGPAVMLRCAAPYDDMHPPPEGSCPPRQRTPPEHLRGLCVLAAAVEDRACEEGRVAKVECRALSRADVAGAALLFNAEPGRKKLSLAGIDSGCDAEKQLLEILEGMEAEASYIDDYIIRRFVGGVFRSPFCAVTLAAGRVVAVACARPDTPPPAQAYAPAGAERAAAIASDAAEELLAVLLGDEKARERKAMPQSN